MSQFLLDYNKDLLATLVSLRVFTISSYKIHHAHTEKYLPYITEVSDRAPHIEFFAIFGGRSRHYVKRVCGKWVICGEAEFPSHKLEL
jgi:hypothetical protein